MRGPNLQYFILGAIIGVFVISRVADAMIDRAAILLDRDTRDRIWKRETLTLLWWRAPDLIGIAAMVAGICKTQGLLRGGGAWGMPTMAAGLIVICMSTILRSWLVRSAYRSEAPGTPASESASKAAVLVTGAEILLAACIGYFILLPLATAPSPTLNTASTQPANSKGPQAGDDKHGDLYWVSEPEALTLLKGKDAAYLDLLVRAGEVRIQKDKSQKKFRRDDISQSLIAGLPDEKDLKQIIARKEQPAEKPAPAAIPKAAPSADSQPLKE